MQGSVALKGMLAVLMLAATPAAAQHGMASGASVAAGPTSLPLTHHCVGEAEKESALRAASSAEEKGRAKLDLALVLAGCADLGQRQNAELIHAEELLHQVMREAKGKLRIEAYNNYGILLLRQGRYAEAEVTFSTVDGELRASHDFDRFARARFFYNLGVASAGSLHQEQAAAAYATAVRLDPAYKPPSEALLALAQARERGPSHLERPAQSQGVFRSFAQADIAPVDTAVPNATSLLAPLIEQRDPDAVSYLRSRLEETGVGGRKDFTSELALLVHLLQVEGTRRADFETKWLPILDRARSSMNEASVARLNFVVEAYRDDRLPVVLAPSEGARLTAAWQVPSRDAAWFSAFLKVVGDDDLAAGHPDRALARYALAWSSTTNFDAAVYLASVLLKFPAADPHGRVLDTLVNVLFSGKLAAYGSEDWPNIYRFHTLLGSIFDRQGKWGSADDPHSAIFQWEHALAAYHHLPADSQIGEPAPVPGLYAKLANAYASAGRKSDALEQYMVASESYLASGRPEAADTLLLKIVKLAPVNANAAQQTRIAGLKQAVDDAKWRVIEAGAGVRVDESITSAVTARLAAEPEIDRGDITVRTVDGTVTLSGWVRSESTINVLSDLVRGVPEVRGVVTQDVQTIEYVPPPKQQK